MRFNPIPFIIFFFLTVGLIWSDGHVAWLVVLGLYVLFVVSGAVSDELKAQKRRTTRRRR